MDNIGLEMFKMWNSSWRNYVQALGLMQDQGERMLDLAFGQSQAVQEETKRLLKDGMTRAQEAQKSYLQVVNDNFKKIEELLGQSYQES
ncbi:MAG: hypothetical protein C4519_01455 [Desulfobacteraceae bacterium]|nr:MAG: hypothetical protein C4519_01455 [Desulfobacteraceae bacterium]